MQGNDIIKQSRFIKAIKAHRQHVVLTHNPSSIEPGQTLQIRFPNLGPDDVVVPGSFYVSFDLKLRSEKDKARSIVPNVGRKIVKSYKVFFEGHEITAINNFDEISTYKDKWLSKKDKSRRIPQGIQTVNGLKLRVGAKDATGDIEEVAIGKTFGCRFRIPIEFPLLDLHPYHQASLADKLEIQLTFNDAKSIILGSTALLAGANDADYTYSAKDIRVEFDQITSPSLAQETRSKYDRLAVPFTRIVEHRYTTINKSDGVVNLNVNTPSSSLSHILILAVDPDDRKPFQHIEKWRNLDITKVNIGVEGVAKVNALYSSGMLKENVFDQIIKLFGENGVSLGEFLTSTYGLLIDLRPSTDEALHGNGANLYNASEGITLEMQRVAGNGGGKLNLHIFAFQDSQLNLERGRFHSIVC